MMTTMEQVQRSMAKMNLAAEESESRSLKKAMLSQFLHPKKVLPCKVQDESNAREFLLSVQQRILAEYWAFFDGCMDDQESFKPITMTKISSSNEDQEGGAEFHVSERGTTSALGGDDEDDGAYSSNLIIRRRRLCILTFNMTSKIYKISIGVPLNSIKNDKCYTLGYIGDRIKDLLSVEKLLSLNQVPSLIHSAASPSKRQITDYPKSNNSNNILPINIHQKQAIDNFKYDIEFIQGPPGTGKSTTIYHIIHQYSTSNGCALISCVSNKAIDAIAEKFAKCNLKFIVVGRDDRIGVTACQWTLQAQIEKDVNIKSYITARDKMRLYSKILDDDKNSTELVKSKTATTILNEIKKTFGQTLFDQVFPTTQSSKSMYNIVWKHIEELIVACQLQIQKLSDTLSLELKRTCSAVLVTIDSCGSAIERLDKETSEKTDIKDRHLYKDCFILPRLTLAVLDEAGTIPEAKICSIVANLPNVTRIVSIGDQQQLEPFSDIRKSSRNVNTEGYFHRCLRVLPKQIPMLKIQFRMHPKICQLVSKLAYNDQLITDPRVANLRKEENVNAIFWKTYNPRNKGNKGKKNQGCESKSGKSWKNDTEVNIVCDMAQRLLKQHQRAGSKSKSLLIITFYKGQLFELREELAKRKVLKRDKKTKKPIEPEDASIRVATVDSAQGSEADIVILSCVRSNFTHDVGFLNNQNRSVVALSRARDLLYIVGDSKTVGERGGPWGKALKGAQLI